MAETSSDSWPPTGARLLTEAARFIGTPYKLGGRTPAEGWDCWRCVKFLRGHLFGRQSPCAGDAVPEECFCRPAGIAAHMEAQVKASLAMWRPVAPKAGAAVLLTVFGRAAHVGLLLDDHQFIHAQLGCETVVSSLREPMWKDRVRGVYDA
ncbi:MAG TPA: NlpC/P60 family protein [Phenylobacterium sp.]|nr:NlpC/P60 family protein [Phenylobacterium sp.]